MLEIMGFVTKHATIVKSRFYRRFELRLQMIAHFVNWWFKTLQKRWNFRIDCEQNSLSKYLMLNLGEHPSWTRE